MWNSHRPKICAAAFYLFVLFSYWQFFFRKFMPRSAHHTHTHTYTFILDSVRCVGVGVDSGILCILFFNEMCVVVVKSNAVCGGICTFAKFPLPTLAYTLTLFLRSLSSTWARSNKLLSAMQTHSLTHHSHTQLRGLCILPTGERECERWIKKITQTACNPHTYTGRGICAPLRVNLQAWRRQLTTTPSSVWGKRKWRHMHSHTQSFTMWEHVQLFGDF